MIPNSDTSRGPVSVSDLDSSSDRDFGYGSGPDSDPDSTPDPNSDPSSNSGEFWSGRGSTR